METVEVRWEPLDGADAELLIPLPGRLAVSPATGVVGRESRARGHDRRDEARRGRRGP